MSDNKFAITPFVPSSMTDLERFAKYVHKAGQATSEYEAFYLMQYGIELGIPPIKAVQSLHIIKGNVTMSADMMVSLCLRDQRCEYIEVAESSDKACTYRAKRRGRPEQTFTFTIEMARRAGLIRKGGNWESYPHAMLKARAASHLARQVFPDIVMGIYDPDEIRDVGTAEVVEPEVEQPKTEEQVYAEVKDSLAEYCEGYWPEFYEALVVAGGKEPSLKAMRSLITKFGEMSVTERGEYMQDKIDQYLNVEEADEKTAVDVAKEVAQKPEVDEDGVVDAEFEPAEGVTFDPSRSPVVMEAVTAYQADDQGRVGVLMQKMNAAEKESFKRICRGEA